MLFHHGVLCCQSLLFSLNLRACVCLLSRACCIVHVVSVLACQPKLWLCLMLQVAVFWPGMSKWYKGRVRSFSASTGQHTVCFHDGYVREYHLKHEAVMWLDVPGLRSREDLSHWQRMADLLGDRLHVPDEVQPGTARCAGPALLCRPQGGYLSCRACRCACQCGTCVAKGQV